MDTFLRASKAPSPGPDSYLAKNEQIEALTGILEKGYKFVSFESGSNLAVFEKELPNNPREIIKTMNQQQAVKDLIAGIEQAIEHAQGKGWRSPDILIMLQTLIRKTKEANL